MAWDTTADLLRDLVAWEHRTAPYGGHWPWIPDLLRDVPPGAHLGDPGVIHDPVETNNGGTPVARVAGHRVSVRRALWLAVWGELPDRVRIVGACAEPACVRPVHGHVDVVVGRNDPRQDDDVPLALLRWDAAWPGTAGERRGQTGLDGVQRTRRRRQQERRVPGSSMAAAAALAVSGRHRVGDLADLGEQPALAHDDVAAVPSELLEQQQRHAG